MVLVRVQLSTQANPGPTPNKTAKQAKQKMEGSATRRRTLLRFTQQEEKRRDWVDQGVGSRGKMGGR